MASEVQRVEDWRNAKRQAGYELTTLWLRRDDKRYLEDLAKARQQSLSDCVLDGLRALQPTPRKGKPLMLVDEDQLTAFIATALAKREGSYDQTALAPSTPTTSTPPMCKKGAHSKSYPGECRECKKERNQRSDQKRRATQAGQGMMEDLELRQDPADSSA
jgi:hypothetical protein